MTRPTRFFFARFRARTSEAMGSTPKWLDYDGKIRLKWMITRDALISGNLHIYGKSPNCDIFHHLQAKWSMFHIYIGLLEGRQNLGYMLK
jgi:hypothetical protein